MKTDHSGLILPKLGHYQYNLTTDLRTNKAIAVSGKASGWRQATRCTTMKDDIKRFRSFCRRNGLSDEERYEFSAYLHARKERGGRARRTRGILPWTS